MKRAVLIVMVLSLSMTSCAFLGKQQAEEEAVVVVKEYANPDRWLSAPSGEEITHDVDLFYLYPSCYVCADGEDAAAVGSVDDESMCSGAAFYLVSQAGAFSGSCNIFAPYYPQMDAKKALSMPYEKRSAVLRENVLGPVKDAFMYYLENFNDGRPFVLAGHSQGAAVLLLLMEDLFDDPAIQDRLVAAYLLGTSVTERDMKMYPHLKFAEGRDDVGVIVSWNTEGEGVEKNNPVVESDALVINPLSWSRDDEFVSRIRNLGAVFFTPEGEELIEIDRFTSAQIDPERRSVVAYEPTPSYYVIGNGKLFPRGCYHLQDYTFFFNNIKANVKQRIKAYLEQ